MAAHYYSLPLWILIGFWIRNESKWDRACVNNIYGGELARRICEIPLLQDGREDRVVIREGFIQQNQDIRGLF